MLFIYDSRVHLISCVAVFCYFTLRCRYEKFTNTQANVSDARNARLHRN